MKIVLYCLNILLPKYTERMCLLKASLNYCNWEAIKKIFKEHTYVAYQ